MKYYVESQNINERNVEQMWLKQDWQLDRHLHSAAGVCLPASPRMPKVNLNIHDLTVVLILVVNVNISVMGMHRLT